MNPPTVHLYALVWNERRLLPFFLEHYRPFVDLFHLYDDTSDDGSFEYLSGQEKVVLQRFDSGGASFVERARDFYCHAWKASRGAADFVIVVNIDEFVYHDDPREALRRARADGLTVLDTRGWEMVSDRFPTHGPLWKTVPRGVHSMAMSKVAIFDPNAVQEINYGPGRHRASPTGRVVRTAQPRFDLLHYKYLAADYLVERYRELGARMRSGDIQRGLGTHYQKEEDKLRDEHERLCKVAVPVVPAALKEAGFLQQPLKGVSVVKLRQVMNDKGGLREVWRDDDPLGSGVKQAYVTVTAPGQVKAWYKHKVQTDQITPLSGSGKLVLWDRRSENSATEPVEIEISAENPTLIVTPPGIWHGFRASEPQPLVLLHLNSHPFDHLQTDEERLDANDPAIPYRWPAAG
jgi:dTDP-4-dehydrorhamnose 3,5-epimerase-like enzyme